MNLDLVLVCVKRYGFTGLVWLSRMAAALLFSVPTVLQFTNLFYFLCHASLHRFLSAFAFKKSWHSSPRVKSLQGSSIWVLHTCFLVKPRLGWIKLGWIKKGPVDAMAAVCSESLVPKSELKTSQYVKSPCNYIIHQASHNTRWAQLPLRIQCEAQSDAWTVWHKHNTSHT